MDKGDRSKIPVQINITKIILFFSAIFFTAGLYLIISTLSQWFYTTSLYDSLEIIKFGSIDTLLMLILLLVVIFFFPSNDQLNLSSVFRKRATFDIKRVLIYIFRLETVFMLFLAIFFLQRVVSYDLIALALLIIAAISTLFQTSYSMVHPNVNFIQSFKLRHLNLIDTNLMSDKRLSNITGSFFSQILPSPENILLVTFMLLFVNFIEGVFYSIVLGLLLTLMTFYYFTRLSKRGNYFRKYTNVLIILLILYLAYQILLA